MVVSISIVGLCWLIFFIWWGVSALFTKKSVTKRGWWWRIYLMIVLILAFIFINKSKTNPGIAKELFINTFFVAAPLISIIAAIFAVAGVSLAIWARIYLGRNWSGYVTYKKNHELVTSGPYKYIRHPIYSGVMLMLIGTWLSFPTDWFSGLFIIYIIIFLWRTKREEKIMIRLFGKRYKDYMKRTKRLIPWIY